MAGGGSGIPIPTTISATDVVSLLTGTSAAISVTQAGRRDASGGIGACLGYRRYSHQCHGDDERRL